MFKLFDTVRIKRNNVIGTIVDIDDTSSDVKYVVESDTKGERSDGFGGIWPLFDCNEADIEKV